MKRVSMIVAALIAGGVLGATMTTFASSPMNDVKGGHHAGMMSKIGFKGHHGFNRNVNLNEIEEKLNLTETQLPLWQTFKTAMEERKAEFTAQHESMKNLSRSERHEAMEAFRKAHQDDFEKAHSARKALIASLDDDQKLVLKQAFKKGGGNCDGRGGHHGDGQFRSSDET